MATHENTTASETAAPEAAQAPIDQDDAFADRPELYVAAAFAGGLVVAGLLKYLGR